MSNAAPAGDGGRFQVELTNESQVRAVVLDAAAADVWAVLPDAFRTLEIEAPFQNTASFQFGNPEFTPRRIEGRRLSRYLSCGTVAAGARADRYEVTMRFIVDLDGSADGTRLETLLDAYARPRDVSGNAVRCTSQGSLEQRLVDLVLERLPEAGGA